MAGYGATADPELTAVSAEEETPGLLDLAGERSALHDLDGPSRPRLPVKHVLAAVAAVSVVLTDLGAWVGYRDFQSYQHLREQERFVAVGRQAALNLTTIDHEQVESDVDRILSGATGAFLEDFQNRAQPFIEVVRETKSKSVGTVTEAGLESIQGDLAQVLVAVEVETVVDGVPAGDPRGWRMRMDVLGAGADMKIANVQFVL